MNKEDIKIVFMGTPDFAVPSLENLISAGYDVVGVITAPDRKAGRGLKLQESAIKKAALKNKLTILQPTNLKSEDFQDELKSLGANLFVVVAFRMLPESVWSMPSLGTFNLHASLLPQYRGAAPINWAIINGESSTGVSTFFIEKKIDTGDLLLQEKVQISENQTAGELHDVLMETGADLVLKTVKLIQSENAEPKKQVLPSEMNLAPKIFKSDCEIDWSQNVSAVHNRIRGLSPYPGAWTRLNGKILKVYRSKIIDNDSATIGENVADMVQMDKRLVVSCGKGTLELLELQLEGKKRMPTDRFLLGREFAEIVKLGS